MTLKKITLTLNDFGDEGRSALRSAKKVRAFVKGVLMSLSLSRSSDVLLLLLGDVSITLSSARESTILVIAADFFSFGDASPVVKAGE